MKLITTDLKTLPEVHIHVFGDLHIGSTKFDKKELEKRIEYVKEDEYARVILLGDLINNSTKTSVGDVYAEQLTPMEQIKIAKGFFEPIKDKIICIVSGNHEARSYKTDGIDLTYFLASELGVVDKYDSVSGCIIVRWGNLSKSKSNVTTIYCTHGTGNGGKTTGGKANGLSKRGQIINADIIITGHTHQPIVFAESSFEIDERHNNIKKKEQLFVNCGSSLGYEEYAETYGMKPSSNRQPIVYLIKDAIYATL